MIEFYSGKPGKAARLVTKPHGFRHLIALSAFDQLDDLYEEPSKTKDSYALPQPSQGETPVKKISKIAAAMVFAGLASIAYADKEADHRLLTQDLVARTLANAESRAASDQSGPRMIIEYPKNASPKPIANDLFDSSKYEHVGSYIKDCGEVSEKRPGLTSFRGADFPFGDYRTSEVGSKKESEMKRERRVIQCDVYKSKDFKGALVGSD